MDFPLFHLSAIYDLNNLIDMMDMMDLKEDFPKYKYKIPSKKHKLIKPQVYVIRLFTIIGSASRSTINIIEIAFSFCREIFILMI
ncbi:uncharacterized protein ASCRUDRAFT_126627 [Ascoidea rubescens DSM 1968]|uniref:Uncharacterized protein n=1 Tax=Ascoidea rubescens DSM 1968 TaxID=1344418 RepID=A0A1D2VN92_9ASCO|nr:hypothetical protein ASCRUDRAFT_126627 [Ascoidea rubescens DSM 1968]ODV63025.1 hypothetical protein ASCRUDRAFT_126627 [Ascoidea rubescens DSM 1968]